MTKFKRKSFNQDSSKHSNNKFNNTDDKTQYTNKNKTQYTSKNKTQYNTQSKSQNNKIQFDNAPTNPEYNDLQFEDDFDDLNESNPSQKKWYEDIPEDPSDFEPVPEGTLIDLKDEAKKCHDSEIAAFNIKNLNSNTNYKWMKGIMSKGTVTDKLAAYTVLVQDNPVHNLETLRNMVGMIKVAKKKECITAMQNLTELFLTALLKPNEKLKAFYQRPLSVLDKLSSGNTTTRKKLLTYWYFEDQLKEVYTSYVLAVNSVGHDTVDANKEKAITTMFKLLEGNPEQEKNLLSYIVNKLGDPSQKVGSKAIYCLNQLLYKHPNMQGVVLTELEKLLFRHNVSTRAQYYGICFMSQFYLNHEDSEVARRLIEVYFSFFKSCIKKGEVDTRMMSALLMGVNRACPYAKFDVIKNKEHIETMYKVVHIASFNVSLHALALLYQVSDFTTGDNSRFYSALYKKLLDPTILTTTHQAMLLNLLYKALINDNEPNRIRTFIKRLLQLASYLQPNVACGILFLVSQVISRKQGVSAMEYKKLTLLGIDEDDEEEMYADIKEESVEEDKSLKNNSQEKTLNNMSQENPVASMSLEYNETHGVDNEDSNNKDLTVVDLSELTIKPNKDLDSKQDRPGWCHIGPKVEKKEHKISVDFRPLSRNPLYAGGEHCTFSELYELKNHFHPTVSLFATQIVNGETIKYTGDPLKDFTLIRFLDRFVFKNPKKKEEISLKVGSHPTFGKRKKYTPIGLRSLSVTSENYLNEKEQNIPADELFMYMFLQKRQRDKANKRDDDDSDLDSVASEEFEEMLDKMGGMYNNDGDDDEEDDLDFDEEVQENLKMQKAKKKKKGKDGDDDLSDEGLSDDGASDDEELGDDASDLDEDMEGLDDDGVGIDGLDDEEFGDADGLDDEDFNIEGSDFEDDFLDDDSQSKGKKKNSKQDKLKKKAAKYTDFAPAEEFAAMLEDEGSSAIKPGGSNVFSNKDKSNTKQLAWEDRRNHWLKGKKGGNKMGNHSKSEGSNRSGGNNRTGGNSRTGGPNQTGGSNSRKRPNQKFNNKAKKFKKS